MKLVNRIALISVIVSALTAIYVANKEWSASSNASERALKTEYIRALFEYGECLTDSFKGLSHSSFQEDLALKCKITDLHKTIVLTKGVPDFSSADRENINSWYESLKQSLVRSISQDLLLIVGECQELQYEARDAPYTEEEREFMATEFELVMGDKTFQERSGLSEDEFRESLSKELVQEVRFDRLYTVRHCKRRFEDTYRVYSSQYNGLVKLFHEIDILANEEGEYIPVSLEEMLPFGDPVKSDRHWITRTPSLNSTDIYTGEPIVVRHMCISTPEGSPILSTITGEVIKVYTSNTGWGKSIHIQNEFGFETAYHHLSEVQVQVGDTIEKNDQIALSGNSGNTIGWVLSYRVLYNSWELDPTGFVWIFLEAGRL